MTESSRQKEGRGAMRRRQPSTVLRYAWLPLLLGLAIVFVGNASRPGMRLEGCPQGCATASRRRDGALRVMSLNMLHGYPRFAHLSGRLDAIAEEIRRLDPDIVCLQEVPWTRRLGNGAQYLAQRTGLNYLYLRANGNRRVISFEEGEAILSRYPLHGPTFMELQPQAGFFEHRVVLHATATTPWGNVGVFVTHLTHGDADVNHQQAASLMRFAATGSGPAIVAGDFNATEDSPQIQAITARWIDTYRAAMPDADGPTCCIDDLTTGPDERPEVRIDYLFLVPRPGGGVAVRSAQRVFDQPFPVPGGWLWASDHVGLLVTIDMAR
jgi:endonuclease/exonuclease/phosphatase family metal-dependent hydrolase